MNRWRDIVIRPSDSVQRAIQTIDRSTAQIALVVDSRDKLLGTVTDGDVRRGILKGISLEEKVERVMRKTPIVLSPGGNRKDIEAVLRQKMIRQLPIVDADGKVLGVDLIEGVLQSGKQNYWAVLMAGGLGSRLYPITKNVPKPLIEVGEKPILETILENFMEYGFSKFYFTVWYKDHMIKDYFGDGSRWNVSIKYITEEERLGTAGSLGLLPEKPPESFFVMNADLLTKINFDQFLHFHHESRVAGTMCVREYDFQVPYGVVNLNQKYIKSIDEKPVHRFFVNAGIYMLEPGVLNFIPRKKYLDMPQLFEKLIDRKKRTAAFPIREYWIDVGRMADLERAKNEFDGVFSK